MQLHYAIPLLALPACVNEITPGVDTAMHWEDEQGPSLEPMDAERVRCPLYSGMEEGVGWEYAAVQGDVTSEDVVTRFAPYLHMLEVTRYAVELQGDDAMTATTRVQRFRCEEDGLWLTHEQSEAVITRGEESRVEPWEVTYEVPALVVPHDLEPGAVFVSAPVGTIHTASGARMDFDQHWTITVTGTTEVEVQAGRFEVLELERVAGHGDYTDHAYLSAEVGRVLDADEELVAVHR